jgi:hypothetical protein
MARNPRSRASKAGNRKALQAVRAQLDDVDDLYAGLRNQDLDKLAAERAERGGKFLGTDERGLPTMSRLTPEQEAEAAAGYAEKLKDKPGFEEAARVTAEGRLPGMPDDLPETTGRALAKMGVDDMDDMGQLPASATGETKAEEKLDVEPMNWTGYGGFEYSVDPARPDQIKINGKLFTDEKLREVTRKRGKEVGIEDIMLEKSDIESKGIKIAPRAKETPTARRRRIAEKALAPSTPTPTLEELPTPEPEDFMTGAGAMPAPEVPSLQEAFATPAPEERPPERTRAESLAARSEAARNVNLNPEQARRIVQLAREVTRKTDKFGRGDVQAEQQAYQNILESLGLGASDFPAAQPRSAIGSEMADESVTNRGNELFNTLKRKADAVLYQRGTQPADVERMLRESQARRRGR